MRGVQVAVFDTAFHQTMPAEAYMYALPWDLYKRFHVRKYGFHGTSYSFLVKQVGTLHSTCYWMICCVRAHPTR